MIGNNKPLLLTVIASFCLVLFACSRPNKTAAIIEEYRAATCILPLGYAKQTYPPTLEWDQTLTLRDGTAVQIHGLEAPGARIAAKYQSSGADEVGVTQMVDYVYPTDIRIDNKREILYVKTDGYVGGITKRTCLFAFDLNKRKTIIREEVDNSVLPPECLKRKPEKGNH
jgi:hypothetical protein